MPVQTTTGSRCGSSVWSVILSLVGIMIWLEEHVVVVDIESVRLGWHSGKRGRREVAARVRVSGSVR